MRDTLYLQLRDAATDDAAVASAVVSGTPGAAIRVEQSSLKQALAQAAGRRLVVFVPGGDVRLSTVQVPARQARKILQAAPYALEDQLAEDVETLHFAIAPVPARREPGEAHAVAIVARARMEQWLAPLRAHGLRADALVPETLSLPLPDASRWTGLAEPGRVTVRTGAYAGFTCPIEDLGTYLQLADPDARMPLRLYVARELDHDFTRLGRPVELLPGYGSPLEVLVRNWRPQQSIDLLQAAYSEKEDWQRLARPWRLAAAVALAWAGVALASEVVQALRVGAELRRQEQANIERFRQLFPEATRFENLALQAQQQLLALRGGGPRAPLFQLLDALAAALSATPGLTLQSMQFREGALYLSLTAGELQTLENLRAWFAARPQTALAVQDTNASPDGVQIRVKLTPA